MHQTTIRFDSELWQRIDAQSARAGVSAAQYIRDATLIRLTQAGGPELENLTADGLRRSVKSTMAASDAVNMDSRAVWAQARQTRERARNLREAARQLVEAGALRPWAGSNWTGHQKAEGR